ncbi:MAG TPA: glycosyltransferase family 4 protein [Bacteroidia bacterium]|nr:glycosyltransferase family 4 protein [Bacteroidia bacterium]
MKRKKILFVAAHRPDRSPSQRFRFEQYLAYLQENGFDYDYSTLISAREDKKFYSPGKLRTKLFILLKSWWKRKKDTWRSSHYDIIFVQREAFMTGSTRFEKKFAKSGAKLIFDFDDAIWNLDISEGNKRFGWLKNPGKTAELIAMSDLVIAGNKYLADYALRHNKNVVIIPTTIDMKKYDPVVHSNLDGKICIGWSGSHTTIKHFEFALPFLRVLKKKYGDKLEIKVVGDNSYANEELGIRGITWSSRDEIKVLSSFDIGIMPLPDDEWAKGKCGLKGLQYMALGIPTIMSPVGVNTEIITHGENGMLATTTEEWVEKIEELIASAELRVRIGQKARETVEQNYSADVWKQRYLKLFDEVLSR